MSEPQYRPPAPEGAASVPDSRPAPADPGAASALRGLYAVTPDEADTARLLAVAEQVLAGRPALLQYRNKTADAALRRIQARALHASVPRGGRALHRQ